MKDRKDDAEKAANLRRRAEAVMEQNGIDAAGPAPEDVGKLLSELQTHQIEMELQNAELRAAQEELVASRDRYVDLYDFAPTGYVTVSQTGMILDANLTIASMLDVERQSLVNQPFSTFVVPDDQDILYRHRREAIEPNRSFTCQLRLLRGNAEEFWAELKSVLIEGDDGSGARMQIAIADVTERHLAEDALHKAHDHLERRVAERTRQLAGTVEELRAEITRRKTAEDAVGERDRQLRTVMEAAPDGIAVIVDSLLVYANRALGRIMDRCAESLVGTSISDHIHPEDLEKAGARARAILSGGPEYQAEYRLLNGEGTVLPVAAHSAKTTFGGKSALVTIIRDMTLAKRTEGELLNSREQLRQLSARLQRAGEDERKWVSAEIHDELGQTMTALAIDLRWIYAQLSEGQQELSARVVKMTSLLDSTIDSVQRIVFRLRPPVLDDLGLVAAIQWLVDEFAERTGVACRTALPQTLDVDSEVATAVFRISQEALTNVARHAGADEVQLDLRIADSKIELAIEDDGRGVAAAATSADGSFGSFGLLGMQERARTLGGTVDIIRVCDAGGTLVRLSLPLGSSGWESSYVPVP